VGGFSMRILGAVVFVLSAVAAIHGWSAFRLF
jgi:hypothetical protein